MLIDHTQGVGQILVGEVGAAESVGNSIVDPGDVLVGDLQVELGLNEPACSGDVEEDRVITSSRVEDVDGCFIVEKEQDMAAPVAS